MLQQIIAIIIILFFLVKLIISWKKQKNSFNESLFWLSFWFLAMLIILFIKQIDNLVMELGFSSSGINLVFYLAVLFLFYLFFKMKFQIIKYQKDITQLSRDISLMKNKIEKD